jgi:hypothetical protein
MMGSMTTNLYNFVCLDHENTTLYTEVVQILEQRQYYWVRPVLLCESFKTVADNIFNPEHLTVHDVRSCSDLLWPSNWFRQVFDTEFIPLLDYFDSVSLPCPELLEQNSPSAQLARKKLQTFIQGFWNANVQS